MRVRPFRGYRYATGECDLSKLVAPPYDQISAAMQARLYGMSPQNIVRVSCPQDTPGAGRYRAARMTLEEWLADDVFVREDRPAIYPYHQMYVVGGEMVTRRGFIALGEASDYARGIVLPHERTHREPKEDRLRLLEATGADIGLLFMLVSDPTGELGHVRVPAADLIAEARDLRGEVHRLWRVSDETAIRRLQAFMATTRPIIADGHHRYETAVEYRRRHPGSSDKLMAFFALEAPGLTIFANHRLVHGVHGFALDRFLDAARRWFAVSPLADPVGFRPTNRRIGVVTSGTAHVLTLGDDAFDKIAWPAGSSRAWRELAVSILHEGLLRPLLDITDEKLEAKTHVDYTADQAEAVALAHAGRYQAAFLIGPTTPDELQVVVRGGELLPQKSTHFYPKLLDGLVFHRLGEA
jgi:uncharacterized protein (DUF1015 family)